jgi:hypothetical protein
MRQSKQKRITICASPNCKKTKVNYFRDGKYWCGKSCYRQSKEA